MGSMVIGKVSIACPAYNEAQGVEMVMRDWLKYLSSSRLVQDYEIVICNDGSRDGTGRILDELAKVEPRLRVIHHDQNQGAAAALYSAIAATRGDWVLLLDSDGQFPVENLEPMARAIGVGDVLAVLGRRTAKSDSLFARMGSFLSGRICSAAFGARLDDFNSALKLVNGSLLRSLPLEAKGLNYSCDITAKILQNCPSRSWVEVEAIHQPRLKGRSSRSLFRSSWQRMLFVGYLIFQNYLLKNNIILNSARIRSLQGKNI